MLKFAVYFTVIIASIVIDNVNSSQHINIENFLQSLQQQLKQEQRQDHQQLYKAGQLVSNDLLDQPSYEHNDRDDDDDQQNEYSKVYVILNSEAIKRSKNKDKLNALLSSMLVAPLHQHRVKNQDELDQYRDQQDHQYKRGRHHEKQSRFLKVDDADQGKRYRYKDKRGRYQDENDQYQDKRSRYRDENDQYQDKRGRYQDENDRYQDKRGRYQDENDRYQDKRGRYQDENDRYQDKRGRYQDENDRYQDKRNRYQDKNERFQDKRGRYQNEKDRYKEKNYWSLDENDDQVHHDRYQDEDDHQDHRNHGRHNYKEFRINNDELRRMASGEDKPSMKRPREMHDRPRRGRSRGNGGGGGSGGGSGGHTAIPYIRQHGDIYEREN